MSSAATTAALMAIVIQQQRNRIKLIINGKEYAEMNESMLNEIIGKEVQIVLFGGELGSYKGRILAADSEWIKLQTTKGIQYINRQTVNTILVKEPRL